MGYSLGAATALRLAIQHPSLVRRLVLTSFPCRRDGWFPESLAGMDQMGSQLAPMPAAVIPFLDEPALEPPAPFGQ
jgi:pimeloyl-ACP methyl ester carboxylesterase